MAIDSGIVPLVSVALPLWLAFAVTVALVITAIVRANRRRARPAPAERDDLAPVAVTEFGPYRLVEKIGEGGMAEVFSAVHHESTPAGPLVVKCLRPELTADPIAVTHFLDEGQLSASLVHPNIVRVFEAGIIEGRHYLTQEYVAGRDLGCLTRTMVQGKQRPLSAAAILHLAHELLQALEYAHGKRSAAGNPLGVVHCDVSPENILLSLAGEVKLLDFGIARSGLVGIDEAGEGLRGNVDFMSPEQARGLVVDPRSDLFSVGLVVYYCAARAPLYRPPIRNSTVYDRLALAAAGPGDEERAFIAGLPPPLPDILPRVLTVDLERRVQSARALRLAISPFIGGGGAELATTVQRLFGGAIAAETNRVAAATPPEIGRRRQASAAIARTTA
jgi:eukaryotic-like serine/threonine-protein kinase